MHLTEQEFQSIVDNTIDPGRKEDLLRHAAACQRCSVGLSLERSLSQAIRTSPLHKTASQFTSRIMNQIDPGLPGGLVYRVFGGAGRILAMAGVLFAIAFALTLNFPGTADSHGPATAVFGEISSYYDSAKEFLTNRSTQVNQTMDQSASGQGMQILAMTFVVFIALGLLDRFVLRHFVRMKIQ